MYRVNANERANKYEKKAMLQDKEKATKKAEHDDIKDKDNMRNRKRKKKAGDRACSIVLEGMQLKRILKKE